MIIRNGYLITMNSEYGCIDDGAIRISDGIITHLGKSSDLVRMFAEDDVTDAEGMLVLPGNICGHTHFYGAFSRGIRIPGNPPGNFMEILQRLWWKLDRALDEESIRHSALVCLIDAIRHGTTTLIDHHASPACIDGSLDIIAEAVLKTGLRACLCYEVTDRNGKNESAKGIRENIRFHKKCRMYPHDSLAASFGLHASMTVSNNTLDRCASEADIFASGFHLHAAESISDQIDCLKKHGTRVIHRLYRHRILGPKSLLAHGVCLDDSEVDCIAGTQTFIAHLPRSNMNNAVGTAHVDQFLKKKIRVCFGNDGFGNNMWEEWKTAYLVHKLVHQDPRVIQGYDIIQMAVHNNSALTHVYWPNQKIGTLEPGASADCILVNYKPFTPLTADNFPWHILFGFEADMIHSTMARGRWLMRNRVLLHLDEQKIFADAQQSAATVWDRFQKGFVSP